MHELKYPIYGIWKGKNGEFYGSSRFPNRHIWNEFGLLNDWEVHTLKGLSVAFADFAATTTPFFCMEKFA